MRFTSVAFFSLPPNHGAAWRPRPTMTILTLMRFTAVFAFFGLSGTPTTAASGNINDALLKQRTILLGSPINDAAANDVIAKLLFLEMESSTEPIHLLINSPGGLVLAGLAITDTMDKVRAPVSTHCLGTAHSMAAVILAYGRAGSRTAEANSTITFTIPRAPDDADEQKTKDPVRLGEILITKTASATKRPVDEIRKLFRDATPLSSKEALAFRIIDRVDRTQR